MNSKEMHRCTGQRPNYTAVPQFRERRLSSIESYNKEVLKRCKREKQAHYNDMTNHEVQPAEFMLTKQRLRI